MKLNKWLYLFLIYLCLVLVINSQEAPTSDKKSWCWTKSMANEPNFILNSSLGGLNWGYCQQEEKVRLIKYTATVYTSQIEKSESNSPIKVTIFGDKGKTDEKILSSTGFDRGTEKKIEFEAQDVGRIEKVTLRVMGHQGYRCKNIMFKKESMSTNFECLKRIESCKPGVDPKQCVLEMLADGDTPFQVTVKTSEEKDGGTKSPLFIQLKGTKGESTLRILSELGLEKGSSETNTIYVKDVGDVTGYKLMIGAQGKWKPTYLSVKSLTTGIIKNFEILNAALISPGSDTLSVNQNDQPEGTENTDKIAPAANKDPGLSNEDTGSENQSEEKENLNINSPQGGLIDVKEKKHIINLSCEQKLVNPSSDEILFGPDYPTRDINYMRVLAKCPSDCHKVPGSVFGVGMHPEASPICLSAIVDRAVSLYGGIISISIFPGLDSYKTPPNFPNKINQISIKSLHSKTVLKSYIVSKVDNIDLVEKDIRIIDKDGNLAAEGRLEIRMEGRWGSTCSLGNNLASARVICKNLGYRGGEWKSPSDEKGRDFCKTFKGFDYCAAEGSYIHFEKFECSPKDTHINTCAKQLANQKVCNHSLDAIISCTNENVETETPLPVGVVRLAAISNEKNTSFLGRLEMFNEQKFSPICDLGFNKDSAVIACKQMGYLKGEQVMDPKISKAFKIDNSSNAKFAATNMECRGSEKQLKECKSVMTNITCKHDQDVVVRCFGDKGDPTGKSQYMPNTSNPAPELGKLGIPKIQIECKTKGNNIMFRGDPGSIYLLQCPTYCSKQPGTISGTGLYTVDSNICIAAIHAGVIQNNIGGIFAFIKSFGQLKYDSSAGYGLLSDALNTNWISSFSVSTVNSGWINMNKMLQNKLGNDNDKKNIIKTSFIETEGAELEANIPPTVFKFVEPHPNFLFKQESNFLYESKNVPKLTKWTILAKFKMEKFLQGKKHIIFSSGCSGFNVFVGSTDHLVIGSICESKKRLDTQILVPLKETILLYAVYEKGKVDLKVFSDKLGMISKSLKFDMEMDEERMSTVTVGKNATGDGLFFGEINFVNLFDSIVPEKMINLIIEKMKNLDKGEIKMKKTEDGRDCLSPCIDSKPGEGIPPNDAKMDVGSDISSVPLKDEINRIAIENPGENNNESNLQNGVALVNSANGSSANAAGKGLLGKKVNSKINGLETDQAHVNIESRVNNIKNAALTHGTYEKGDENNQETMQVDCLTNLSEKRFSGRAGKVFRVHCPVCGKEKSVVFGTGIYHPYSSICKAASHWGILKPGFQADILVELTGKKEIFTGSDGLNKFSSASFSGAETSFKVRIAAPLKQIKCVTTAGQDIFQAAPLNAKFVVVCPEFCSKSKEGGLVFGSEIYADTSAICLAAIHYGVLSDKGGEVEFMIEGEQNDFKATKGFGVTSVHKEAYIRSFRFLGHNSAVSYTFKEDYSGKLIHKWNQVQSYSVLDKDKDSWNYITEQKKNSKGIFEQLNGIVHKGTIRNSSEEDNNPASVIFLKEAEFANGIIKFNIKIVDLHPILIVFRFSDMENYYAVEIYPKSKLQNIKFISKVNSSIKITDSKNLLMIQAGVWLRCTLIIQFEDMKFLMQQENVRENKLVFNAKIPDLQRGSFGFGSNGNNEFYMSGIAIDEYKPNQEIKTLATMNRIRTFEQLLKKTTSRDIKRYCAKIFEKTSNNYQRCEQPHTHCQIKCDSAIPKDQENITNYKCFKTCVKMVYNNNIDKLLEMDGKINKWEAKEGLKVDFLVNGETKYRPATVIEVQRKMKKKTVVVVEFLGDTGEPKKATAPFPSKNIVKCGEKLARRTDCKGEEKTGNKKVVKIKA